MPSGTCMDWLCWWYNHAADVGPPSIAMAFVTKISEKRKPTSASAIRVKNRWKTISTEERVDVISLFEKDDWIVDVCCEVRFAFSSKCTIHNKADRITESEQDYHRCWSLTFLVHEK
jgi:hypothetical protein